MGAGFGFFAIGNDIAESTKLLEDSIQALRADVSKNEALSDRIRALEKQVAELKKSSK